MQRRIVAAVVVFIAISGLLFYWVGTRHDVAIGQLARAESAQTPTEVTYYVTIAKSQLPESGSISWWSTERADFKSIQIELDDIINRAKNISSLDLGDELYNSEMYDIHARLGEIQESLLAF